MQRTRAAGEEVTARPYRDDRDWWATRALLLDTQARARPGWGWDLRRWDGWRFHRPIPLSDADLAALVGLWETPEGRLVGAVHPEAVGEAFVELDPASRAVEPDMITWAEEHLAASDEAARTLTWWVPDADMERQRILGAAGYERQPISAWLRLRTFDRPVGEVPLLPDLYVVRTTRTTDEDCARMAELLNAAFGRTSHSPAEYRTFVERSPSFEHALNLVAVAEDGSFAAHVGVTWDAANRHGIFEPVCTHPDHRRRGLARALIVEGIGRLESRGARTAQVDTGDDVAANELYASCGFTDACPLHAWRRRF